MDRREIPPTLRRGESRVVSRVERFVEEEKKIPLLSSRQTSRNARCIRKLHSKLSARLNGNTDSYNRVEQDVQLFETEVDATCLILFLCLDNGYWFTCVST